MRYVGLEHIEPHSMKLLKYGHAREARSSAVRFSKGDILYGKMRPYLNKVWVAEFDGLCSAEFLVFKKQDGLNTQFLGSRLNSEDFVSFANRQVSGERPRVDFEKLSHFQILLPPLSEQERIVNKLSAAFSKVDRAETAARRAKKRLGRYRGAVLDAAVSGELSRTWREADWNAKKGKSKTPETPLQNLLNIRRHLWEIAELERLQKTRKTAKDNKSKSRYSEPVSPDTENITELPREWSWVSLDQVFSSLRNGISQAPRETDGLPILRISAVRALSVELKDCRYLPVSTAEKYKDYALQEGDLLFTRYNGSRDLAGVCGRVPSINQTVVYPDKLIRGIPVKISAQTSSFVAIAANSGASRRYIEAHLFTTAGQWGISGRNLKCTPLPFPPAPEQAYIVREVLSRLSAADRLQASLELQLIRATATRQSLLHEAFSGHLLPQDPNDEPASGLLRNIRAAREKAAQNPRGKRMPKSKPKSKLMLRPLLDILREHGEPMTPEQLFRDSGYQQEFEDNECRQEVVDRFYEELRQQVGPKGPVLEKRPDRNTVLLQVKP